MAEAFLLKILMANGVDVIKMTLHTKITDM